MSYLSANKKRKVWKLLEHTCVAQFSEAYSEPSQTTKIEHFMETLTSFKPLTNFAENSFLDV